MTRVIIIYAPDDTATKKCADHLQKAFTKKEFFVDTRCAGKADIADIAAADAVILGSRGNRAVAIHADYQELLRAFSGVNFAGRIAGIYMEKDTNTFIEFSEALKDSDILIFDEPLFIPEKGIENTELTRWVKKYSTFLKENLHG